MKVNMEFLINQNKQKFTISRKEATGTVGGKPTTTTTPIEVYLLIRRLGKTDYDLIKENVGTSTGVIRKFTILKKDGVLRIGDIVQLENKEYEIIYKFEQMDNMSDFDNYFGKKI